MPSAEEERVDEVIVALESLEQALQDNIALARLSLRRAVRIKRLRRQGLDYRGIVRHDERPLIVEMMRENLARLVEAGSEFQHAQARTLHGEGMTMEQIADLYGVTRQRVSAILRKKHPRV